MLIKDKFCDELAYALDIQQFDYVNFISKLLWGFFVSLEALQAVFVPFCSLEEAAAELAQKPYALVLRVIVPVFASFSYRSH